MYWLVRSKLPTAFNCKRRTYQRKWSSSWGKLKSNYSAASIGHSEIYFNEKKTIFLNFSHEKDGIGAKILNLLDMAVEIPQLGVVRSLNVHVTASIFMWEYCKQHLIEDEFNVSR